MVAGFVQQLSGRLFHLMLNCKAMVKNLILYFIKLFLIIKGYLRRILELVLENFSTKSRKFSNNTFFDTIFHHVTIIKVIECDMLGNIENGLDQETLSILITNLN